MRDAYLPFTHVGDALTFRQTPVILCSTVSNASTDLPLDSERPGALKRQRDTAPAKTIVLHKAAEASSRAATAVLIGKTPVDICLSLNMRSVMGFVTVARRIYACIGGAGEIMVDTGR